MTDLLPLQVVMIPVGGFPLDVTEFVDNLEMHYSVPGGVASVSFNFNQPLASVEWLPYTRVAVIDTSTAIQLCGAILADPGRTADASGEAFHMQALGASSTFKDVNRPRVWIDSSLESWGRGQPPYQLEGVTTQVDKADIVNGPGICMTVSQGTDLDDATGLSYVTYLPFIQTGQFIGSVDAIDAGGPGGDETFLVRYTLPTDVDATNHAMSSSPTEVQLLSGIDFDVSAPATQYMNMAWETGMPDDDTAPDELWQRFGAVHVKPVLATKLGTVVTDAPTAFTTWQEVVGDLLGGSDWLPLIDGPSAFMDTTGPPPQAIPHFAYPDGTTAADVLSDLLQTEQAYYWAAWDLLDNGKYSFEWRVLPTIISFDYDLAFEHFDNPGSVSEIYNAVTIRWRDQTGNINSQRFFNDVPLLDLAGGVIREKLIDLGDNVDGAGVTVAQTAADFLANHAFPTRSGTLTVDRPVLNNTTGFEVAAWQIRPPFLCTVNGSVPGSTGTVLDGRTVFRCMGLTFRASDGAAILELDQPPLSVTNALRWAYPQFGRRR